MRDLIRLGRKYEKKKQELLQKQDSIPMKFYVTAMGLPLKEILDMLQNSE